LGSPPNTEALTAYMARRTRPRPPSVRVKSVCGARKPGPLLPALGLIPLPPCRSASTAPRIAFRPRLACISWSLRRVS